MDFSKDILFKMESPLVFASRDNYKNIKNVKNLGQSLLRLLEQIKKVSPSMEDDRLKQCIEELIGIFSDYDDRPLDIKKRKLGKALSIWGQMNNIIQSLYSGKSPEDSERKIVERRINVKEAFEKMELPVQYLKGVGPKMAERFAAKKIFTVEDLLYFLPRTYEDRRKVKKINFLEMGAVQTTVGHVVLSRIQHYGRKKIVETVISDGTASLTAKWFKGRMTYLCDIFKKGVKVIFTGEVKPDYHGKQMIHPDFEILDEKDEENLLNFKRIVPIYSETEGLNQKYFRKIMNFALENYSRYIISPIPETFCEKRKLMNIHQAVYAVHFPPDEESLEKLISFHSEAHRRLIYDEFFFFQMGMAVRKSGKILERGIAFRIDGPLLEKFFSILPFELTAAQRRVIREIQGDMSKETAMNRLLQGDVGSGKTVVSMTAIITACENGYQAALMAPTEILAKQHFENIRFWSDQLGLKAVLLIGAMSSSAREEILRQIQHGEANIIVGTHALIQESVNFSKLGAVIIDEQHRFGVMQRATLRNKGIHADVLVMTATPIPRTLAMTVYGDLDVSVIDEMPPGKKAVRTIVLPESRRDRVYQMIRDELSKGHQVFIVYPLVEESEALDLKDATNMSKHLQEDIFPEYRVGLIHGKMKEKEKDGVMSDFLEKRIQILVSTTVIEVGIDVPTASLMVIEHAERFGLSQLHQLRGRVGRRDIPSTCILLAAYKCSEEARKRLKVMEKTTDGFVIAEEDLAIRGPGDFLGTRQSGLPDFRIASIIRDASILNDAKEDAFALIERDPFLEKPEHQVLKDVLIRKWHGKLDLARTG